MEKLHRISKFGFIERNKTIILVVSFSFLGMLYFSIQFSFITYMLFPDFRAWLSALKPQAESLPEFYTWEFFIFILANNAGHFCNFLKMLVWVPILGVLPLGLEFGLNGIMIGAALAFAGMERGWLFAVVGVVPHGIFEIPAFILQFTCLARWHITVTEFIHAKIVRKSFSGSEVTQGLRDVALFAMLALSLFVLAAFIETFVTPALLDAIFGSSWRI